MEIGSGRRLSLAPNAVLVETRTSPTTWVPARMVELDQIRAVYRYAVRDWSAIGITGGAWLLALLLLGILAASLRWSAALTIGVLLAATVLVWGAGVFRFLTYRRPLLSIDALGGSLTVPETSPAFFGSLAARLANWQPPPEAHQRELA